MNIVEFVVKLRDMASGPLAKIQQQGVGSFSKIQESVDKLTGRNQALKRSINDIDAKLRDLTKTRNLSLDGSQVERINKQMDTLQAKKDRLEGRSSSGGGLGSFFRTGLAIASIGSLAFLGKDIMQAGIERQMSSTALQTLLGKNAGTRLNGQLLQFAQKSIYGNEVFQEGKLMAGSGIKANNIMPVLSMIGDIAMGDKERMKSLALAFSEASTRGSLTGINERMFLQGGLFNPLEQLHKMTGESLPALKKDMEKGKISIDELVKSMEYATGPMGRWHNMMQKMQDTPAGKWTAFTGTVRTLAGTIGLALLPALGHLTDFMMWLVDNTSILYSVAAAIGAMTAAWMLYTAWTERAAIWQGILEVAAYWPIALVGLVVGAISYMMFANNSLADSTDNVAGRVTNSVGLMAASWSSFSYIVQSVWLGIVSTFERFNNLMTSKGLKGAWDAIIGDTDADKKLAKVKADHMNVMQSYYAQRDGYAAIDPKTGKPAKSSIDQLMNYKPGQYQPDGTGGGATPTGSTSAAITGGGVRTININVQKFQDKTEIHTATFKEGIADVERTLQDMFERIVNSAATALS